MPGLYGIGANVTVNSSNTTGLYAVANTGNVYTGNISSSNTTGLYIGAGTPTFLNNAELLLLLLDNTGNVNFALDPTTNNSTVYSYFVGSIPDVYSNANVAAFLPGYTGTLDNSVTIINLLANAGVQATAIDLVNANLTAFETYANLNFGEALYGNSNVAAYLPINSSNVAGAFFIGDGSKLTNLPTGTFYSNANVAAYLPTYTGTLDLSSTIIALTANAAAQEIDITTLFDNQTILQGEILAANANIAALNANLGAFEAYANATFTISSYGNSNVAAYLPTDPTITGLESNAAVQQTEIDALNANLGAFETYANLTFGAGTYSNANVAAYLPTYTGSLDNSSSVINLYANAASQAIDINTLFNNQTTLQNEITAANLNIDAVNANVTAANLVIAGLESNAAGQAIEINNINANVTAANLNIDAVNANVSAANLVIAGLESNAAAQANEINSINANVFAANLNIDTINANLGAFETYVNATFSTSTYSNANVIAFLPTYTGNVGANAITNTGNISIFTNKAQNVFVSGTDYTLGDVLVVPDGLGSNYLQFINPVSAITNNLEIGDDVTLEFGSGPTTAKIDSVLYDFPGNPNPPSPGYKLNPAVGVGSAVDVTSVTIPAYAQWQFTQSGNIVFPDGTVQPTAAPNLPTYGGNVALEYITNGSANWRFQSDGMLTTGGSMTMPAGAYIIAPNEVNTGLLVASTAVKTDNYQFANGTPVTFYTDAAVAAYLLTYGGSIALSQITAGATAAWTFSNDGKIASTNAGGAVNLGLYSTFSSESGIVDVRGGATTGPGAPGYVYTNTLAGPNAATIPLNITNPTGIKVQAATGTDSLFVGDAILGATDLDLYGNLYARDSILITNGIFWQSNGNPYVPDAYGNTQVAEYLPTYTGTLDNSSTIIAINGNIAVLDANVGAFETYANLTFGPGAAGFYSNANVANYLPVYGGNILATVVEPFQPYIQTIGANNNNSVTQVTAGNNVVITANAGPSFSNAGGIIIVAGNTEVKSSGTFFTAASKYTFSGHSDVNNGNDPSSYMKMYVPTAVYGQFQSNSTQFGANTFSVFDGNVYIGPLENNVPSSGILRVQNRILVNDGGVSLIGNTISTVGVINSGGNVSAPYFIGDGSQLTNVPTSYGNTQVAQYLPSYTGNIGNVGITTGRRYIYSGNIDLVAGASDGSINIRAGSNPDLSDGFVYVQSEYVGIGSTVATACVQIYSPTTITQNNATTGNVLFVNGNIVADTGAFGGGRVYADYFIGDGGFLTNVATAYGNTQVAAFLPSYTGSIAANISDGTQPYIYDIGSILNATSIRGAGVSILGTGSNITLNTGNASAYVNNIIGRFRSTTNVEVTSGAYFIGDGSKLTGLSSNYGNTEVAAYLPTFSGSLGGTLTTAAQTNITSVGTLSALTVTGNVSAGNVSGTKGTFTTVQGTLITAAQTNITSVGTLDAVTVTGAATVGNVITTNGVFWANGVAYSTGGGGGTYGNTEVAAYLPTYTGSLAYTSQSANVNYNNNYINNAILGITVEKTSNIGVIQGAVTIDANIGPIQTAVVTANITINTTNITNMSVGESVTLVLTQNTNANLRILTSNLKYAGASKTLSTANAAIDTISITYDGTNYLAALVKGYA